MPFERRHLDLGAERGLVDRDRHDEVKVVALAPEQRMRFDTHRDVEIAVLTGPASRVAHPGNANARAVGEPSGHADRQRLGSYPSLVAAAGMTPRFRLAAGTRGTGAHGLENTMCPRADFTTPAP